VLTFTTSSGARYTLNPATQTITYVNATRPGACAITYNNVQFRRTPRLGEALEFGFTPARGVAYNPANAPRIFSSFVERISVS
jgi:hypothetical protein